MAAPVKNNLVLGFSPYSGDGIYPFDAVFKSGQDVQKEGLAGVDAVVLWGGQDIHPSLYKQEAHPQNGAGVLPSERDTFEHRLVLACKAQGIPLIGVCRGAQLLCAEAGGKLVQHMYGHHHDHHIDTIKNKRIKVTSSHHQMMYPYDVPHTLIGWSDPPRCTRYEGAGGKDMHEMYTKQEAEIVYFPGIKGLAIQGHPEYAYASKEFIDFCNELVVEYLFGNLVEKKGLST
jgi:anthranilate/para-aminobenzoate synthase component II